MKSRILTLILAALMSLGGVSLVSAQNSAPAPGSGSIGGGGFGGGFGGGMRPLGPPPGAGWGNPWGPGWNSPVYSPTVVFTNYNNANQGTTKVIGCGYDATGVWRTIPMSVNYNYNGVEYDVVVLTAWNPWTQSWSTNLNIPAVNTSYYLNGITYDFYVVLSTGTYYFNL